MPVRVLLVDDDPLVLTGLRSMLGGGGDLELVGAAADGRAAIAAVQELRPDVVLMDITMPVLDGLAAAEAIRASPEPPEVIMLTTFGSEAYVLQALRAGAAGFLLKDAAPAEIVRAVLRVADGDAFLSPGVTRHLMDFVADSPDHGKPGGVIDDLGNGSGRASDARTRARQILAGLTDREREVAAAVGRGRSNAEIAAELAVGLATVKTHLARILTKLDLSNRVQIALLAHEAGLA